MTDDSTLRRQIRATRVEAHRIHDELERQLAPLNEKLAQYRDLLWRLESAEKALPPLVTAQAPKPAALVKPVSTPPAKTKYNPTGYILNRHNAVLAALRDNGQLCSTDLLKALRSRFPGSGWTCNVLQGYLNKLWYYEKVVKSPQGLYSVAPPKETSPQPKESGTECQTQQSDDSSSTTRSPSHST